MEKNPINIDYKKQFDENGYVFRSGFQSPTAVENINANLERLIEEVVPKLPPEYVFYEDKSDPSSLKQIQKIQEHDGFFRDLMTVGPFRELAESLLGSEVTCQNMQYFNKPPGIGKPTPAHQDGFYFKLTPCEAITMWMALEPVDGENGCVRYVPGSHTLGMRPHGSTGTLGFSQGITDFPNQFDSVNEIEFPAEPGDLLAHHALTIHRADGNSSLTRSRRALGFIYYGSKAKQDVEALERYQKKLNLELKQSKKI